MLYWLPLSLSILVALAAFYSGHIESAILPLLAYNGIHFYFNRCRNSTQVEILSLHQQLQECTSQLALQRNVFEVSTELVGCIHKSDARDRFAQAIRCYWHYQHIDLFIWEKGNWECIGDQAKGPPPNLTKPINLPEENNGDLVLDLSPGVDGQAALVCRGAKRQVNITDINDRSIHQLAEVLRGQLALSLRRVMLYHDLEQLGRIDPLTGTMRRWFGQEYLTNLVESRSVVSVCMVDIDLFKAVNDNHGHAVGDRVLAAVGLCLSNQLRTGDMVARFGGEEFLLVLPNTSPEGAYNVAERLRGYVAAISDLACSVTVSIGVASCHRDETADDLISRADKALYQAKHQGRNQVAVADRPESMHTNQMVRTSGRQVTERQQKKRILDD